MKLELNLNDRGYAIADFTDVYDRKCRIREITIGREHPLIYLGVTEQPMSLSPEMVAALLPLLQRFAETGRLGEGT